MLRGYLSGKHDQTLAARTTSASARLQTEVVSSEGMQLLSRSLRLKSCVVDSLFSGQISNRAQRVAFHRTCGVQRFSPVEGGAGGPRSTRQGELEVLGHGREGAQADRGAAGVRTDIAGDELVRVCGVW